MIAIPEDQALEILKAFSDLWGGVVRFAKNPVFPAVTALLGAWTGAWANQRAIDRREKLKADKQAEAVRTMLRLEINHNLAEMEELRDRLVGWFEEERSWTPINPLEPLSIQKLSINALVSDIPKALSTTEIEAIYRFYKVVDQVLQAKTIHYTAAATIPTQIGESSSGMAVFNQLHRDEKRANAYKRLKDLLDESLKKGNPLGKTTGLERLSSKIA